jgi:nitroreductase
MPTKQDIISAFQFRHACKQFDPAKTICAEDFDFILETARLSPSSFGFEPWRLLIIQNQDLRAKLLKTVWGAQGTLPTASHFVAMLYRKDDMRFDSTYIADFMRTIQKLPEDVIEKKKAKYQKFQTSDFNLLDNPRHLYDWAGKQVYIALANMMTAAAMIGIDSCPIEGFDVAETEALLSEAGVLDRNEMGLAVMVAFGYRINPQLVKTRQTQEQIITWIK